MNLIDNKNKLWATALILLILSGSILVSCSNNNQADYSSEYDREAAVSYALKYAEKRNPDYPNLENNCTNYISQCLLEGGLMQDSEKDCKTPKETSRILYDNDKSKWYMNKKTFVEGQPPSYAVSTSFVRTDAFFTYWCDTRGYKLEKIPNDFPGRESFHTKVKLGDVVCLYDENDEISHLGLVTQIDGYEVYYSANTVDRTNGNLLILNDRKYTSLGILHMGD